MCDLISKGIPGSDKSGKHDSRPNRIQATVMQSVHEFKKIPKYLVITHKDRIHIDIISPQN